MHTMTTVSRILVDTTHMFGTAHGGHALPLPLLVGSRDGPRKAGFAALASFAFHQFQRLPRLFRIHSQLSWIFYPPSSILQRCSTQGPVSGAEKLSFLEESPG